MNLKRLNSQIASSTDSKIESVQQKINNSQLDINKFNGMLQKRMQSIMDILKSRQGKSESGREIKSPEFTIDTNNEASCNEDVQLLPETTLLIGDSILKNVNSRGLGNVEIRMIRGGKVNHVGLRLEKWEVDDLKNVILYIGGNDVSDGQDLREMYKQMKNGIESVQRRNPYCEMYVCTICPRADCDVSQANKMLAALCEETGAKLINTFNKFVFGDGSSIPEYYNHDGIHLNKKGTSALVRTINTSVKIIRRSTDARSYHSEIGGAVRNTHKPEAAYRTDRERKSAGQRGERTRRHSDNKSPRQNVAGIDRERDIPVDQCRTTIPASVDEGGMLEIHILVLAFTGNTTDPPTNTIKEMKLFFILFHSFHIDIIGLCETFLTPSVHDNELVIPGYSFVRNDRHDKGGGGIIVYISNKLSNVRRYDLESDTLESVRVQIALPRSKSFDEDLFKADLVNSNLILIDSIADPNFALGILYDTIHTALSNHTTIKQKRIKYASQPFWFSDQIKQTFFLRDYYFLHKDFENYKKTRNKISSMIRKSKNSFYNDAIKNNKSSKFLWQNLNDITNNNKAHQLSIPNKLIINEKDFEGA
ncbi:LOW QUALITY PROTEIN: hypothetical protein MAR_008334, partial [Mya arenaria]